MVEERNMNSDDWKVSFLSKNTTIAEIKIDEFNGELQISREHLTDDQQADLVTDSAVYWNAPASIFAGNRVTSYGGKLTYSLIIQVPGSNASAQTKPDVVLISDSFTFVHYANSAPANDRNFAQNVDLLEDKFVHLKSGFKANREEFMHALSTLREVKIRFANVTKVIFSRFDNLMYD
jgi:hypothetical protein